MFRPAAVFWKAGMIFANAAPGVEYATSDSFVSFVAPAALLARTSAAITARMLLRAEPPIDRQN